MDERGFDSINIIPLVDVMLVLLTIVLTTTTFVAVGAIPMQLPQAQHTNSESIRALTIEIGKDGNLYFDRAPVTLDTLKQKLEVTDRTQPVLIRADRTSALQFFVEVMDLVKGLGFHRVSLQTETRV